MTRGGFIAGAGMGFDAPFLFDNLQAQTFVATVTGRVVDVAFASYQRPNTTAPMRVDITSVVGGLPGSSLAAAFVPVDAFSTSIHINDINVSADFGATSLVLQAGTAYAIVFSSDIPNANYGLYGVRAGDVPSTPDPYPGGESMSSQNGSVFKPAIIKSDFYFRVTVEPVPEPTTIALACSIALCGALVALGRSSRWRFRRP